MNTNSTTPNPSGSSRRPAAASDRPARGRFAGDYMRAGPNLHGPLPLVVTSAPARSARCSDLALVEVRADGKRVRVGYLFPPKSGTPGVDDLDGREFDDRINRYRVTRTGPDRYRVSVLYAKGRRPKRSGR